MEQPQSEVKTVRPPLSFFVAGNPAGQPRIKARFTGKFTQIYTPSTIGKGSRKHEHPAVTWKRAVVVEARKVFGVSDLWQGPLRVDLVFYMPRPKSHFRSNGEMKPTAPKWYEAKPDRDNLDKAVLDALTFDKETKFGLWADDKQVCDGRIQKLYATSSTGCRIEIKEAE